MVATIAKVNGKIQSGIGMRLTCGNCDKPFRPGDGSQARTWITKSERKKHKAGRNEFKRAIKSNGWRFDEWRNSWLCPDCCEKRIAKPAKKRARPAAQPKFTWLPCPHCDETGKAEKTWWQKLLFLGAAACPMCDGEGQVMFELTPEPRQPGSVHYLQPGERID